MKKKIKSVLAVVLSVVISLTALTGCWGRNEDKGFENGFSEGYYGYRESYVNIAVKSEKSKFDINNVVIDLYFGTLSSDLAWWESSNGYTDERFVPVCVAIFFPTKGIPILDKDDYRKSAGYYKEFSLEEFFAEDYGMTMKEVFPIIGEWPHREFTFKHCEQLEISKDIFYSSPTYERGSFAISIAVIFFDNESNEYIFENLTIGFNCEWVTINFTLSENDEVKLFRW